MAFLDKLPPGSIRVLDASWLFSEQGRSWERDIGFRLLGRSAQTECKQKGMYTIILHVCRNVRQLRQVDVSNRRASTCAGRTQVTRTNTPYLRVGFEQLEEVASGGDVGHRHLDKPPSVETCFQVVELVVSTDPKVRRATTTGASSELRDMRLWASYLPVMAPNIHTLVLTLRRVVTTYDMVGFFQCPELLKKLKVTVHVNGH